jgi:hypothetical protein
LFLTEDVFCRNTKLSERDSIEQFKFATFTA